VQNLYRIFSAKRWCFSPGATHGFFPSSILLEEYARFHVSFFSHHTFPFAHNPSTPHHVQRNRTQRHPVERNRNSRGLIHTHSARVVVIMACRYSLPASFLAQSMGCNRIICCSDNMAVVQAMTDGGFSNGAAAAILDDC
jgi:hypothetical protein